MSNFNFSWTATESAYFVDQEHKMMLGQNPSWKPDGENGKGDAIGRSWVSYYTYGDYRFIEGIEKCWVKTPRKTWIGRLLKGKYYYQGYRYPVRFTDEIGISRDHTIGTAIAYKIAGKTDKEMWEWVKHIKFRLSPFALQTIDMWLWNRVISGRKFWSIFYYPIVWCVTAFTAWWNLKIQKKTGIGPHFEVHQKDFKHMQNKDKPLIINKVCKMLYPTYAMGWTAWQFRLLPDGWWKRQLQKQMRRIVPIHNYAIRLILDDKTVTQEDVDSYKSMAGGRWSGNLNVWWNDRSLYIITPDDNILLSANVMDVDYLKKLWEDFGN